MFINRVFLYGNITKKPELKQFDGGGSLCNFTLATNRRYKNRDGEWVDAGEFHSVVCYGKTAENVATYMDKGSGIFVEGRLQTRSWETHDGTKRYKTEVVAERIQFGTKKAGAKAEKRENEQQADEDYDSIGKPAKEEISAEEDEINPDDIPF